MEKYVERGGNTKRAFEIINQELKDAGIPATVNYFNWSGRRKLTFKGKEIVCFFQCDYPSRVNGEIYKGVNPKLRNEVLMDAYHAQIHGIEIGDTVTLEYDKYNEDGITYSKVEEDFIVTGLVNSPTAYLELIMSDEFKDAAGLQTISAGSTINAPKSEHAKYIEMMRDMYGKSSVRNRKEEVKYQLGGYKTEWNLLLAILLPTLAGMMILATILYQSVNIIDETPDIALLKCSGFSNSVIKAWQVIRVVLITGISSVASVVLLNTLLKVLIGKAYFFMGNIVEYEPNRNILLFYIALPLAVIIILAFAIYLTLYGVKKIELWKLRDN